jgi:hypothetical protein
VVTLTSRGIVKKIQMGQMERDQNREIRAHFHE